MIGKCDASLLAIDAAFTVGEYPLRYSTILDSGSTIHIINTKSRFKSIKPTRMGDFLFAGSTKIPIKGYGDVDIQVEGDTGRAILTLKNAAYCNQFACNITSYRQLEKDGIWWDTRPKEKTLRSANGSLVAKIKDIHNQYVLEYRQPGEKYMSPGFNDQSVFTANSSTKVRPSLATAETWHQRLGHPGPQALEHLVNASEGVRIKGIPTTKCDNCATAKIHRQIRRAVRTDHLVRGERLAVDFHDFETDRQGFNSLMLITDRFSGLSFDFYLTERTTSSINAILHYIIERLKLQYDVKTKVIESDGEMTVMKPGVRDFIQNHKFISVEPSAPYSQDQNGGAERAGGVIKEKARAMAGKLPTSLWREIVQAAVYLDARTPKQRLGWKTPYEAFYGKKPIQTYLRAYGCKSYTMTTTALKKAERLKRLNPKAWIGYMVGYAATNIYRIWIPHKGKVISARDVIFNEDAIFDGNIEKLKNDVREASLESIELALKEYEQSTSDPYRESNFDRGAFDEDIAGEDQLDDISSEVNQDSSQLLIDDSTQNLQGEPHLEHNVSVTTDPVESEELQKSQYDAIFEPLLSPPDTPPAALLAIPCKPNLETRSGVDAPASDTRHPQYDAWKSAFIAGSKHQIIATMNDQPISRAKVQKIMKTGRRLHKSELPPLPKSHKHLDTHVMGSKFKQAELEHLASHQQMSSWKEIPRASAGDAQVLNCMWVYVYKYDKHGYLQKCKARLVVRGDQEAKNEEETYAATLAGRSLRTLIALAAKHDLELIQFDATNAFVNASLDKDVYMIQAPGHRKPGLILKLQKALYGLRKSPLLWYREFTKTLRELGFTPVPHEPCCYTCNGVIIFFYVDDFIFAYHRRDEIHARKLVNRLKNRYQLTGGGELQWFLGLEIIRDRKAGVIYLSQASYIDKISKLIEHDQSGNTPMGVVELMPYELQASKADCHRYQRKTGSILYGAIQTRADVAFAASRLTRFNSNPGPIHQKAADRALCYLRNTRALALMFGAGEGFEVASDASYADNTLDRKSSQAFIMKLFGGLVMWRANKQTTVTTSTTEAELLAISQAAKESLFMSRLFKELEIKLPVAPISIQCDNIQTIRLIKAEIATLRTKLRHVDIHNHWLRQEVQEGRLDVTYTSTAEMMADGLTKSLQQPKFEEFIQQLGLVDISAKLRQHVELTPDDLDTRIQLQMENLDVSGE